MDLRKKSLFTLLLILAGAWAGGSLMAESASDTVSLSTPPLTAAPPVDCQITGSGTVTIEDCIPLTYARTAISPAIWVTGGTFQTDATNPAETAANTEGTTINFCPETQSLPVGVYHFNGTISGPGGVRTCTKTVNVTPALPPQCTAGGNTVNFQCGAPTAPNTLWVNHSGGGRIREVYLNGGYVGSSAGAYSIWNWSSYQTVTVTVKGLGGSNTCYGGIAGQCTPGYCYTVGDLGYTCLTPWNNFPTCTWSAYWQGFDGGDRQDHPDRGCVPGCFVPETKIAMEDGSTKAAIIVRVGDRVWNPIRKIGQRVSRILGGPEVYPIFEVGYEDKVVRVSRKHPFLVINGSGPRVVGAEKLALGDSILGADGKHHPLTRLKNLPLDPHQLVYNFELESKSQAPEDHMVLGDGVPTGDLWLQEQSEKGTPP